MAAEKYPKLQQSKEALQQAAKLADVTTQKTLKVPLLTTKGGSAISSAPSKASAPSGAKDLWLTFFFDGTGNNLDADQGNDEHSNVARLYRAHEEDDPERGIFRFYIPGIGTRFAAIGDPGGEMTGNGFGARGEDRLQWAMGRLEQRIKDSGGKGTINVAMFGFSRGATLARAFAVRIAKLSEKKSGVWHFMPAQQPIRLYFLGLFDTVASVGLAIEQPWGNRSSEPGGGHAPALRSVHWRSRELSLGDRHRRHTRRGSGQGAIRRSWILG